MASRNAASTAQLLGVYISRSELVNRPGDICELTEKLSKLNFENVLLWITRIGTQFGARDRHSTTEQLSIAKTLLSSEFLAALEARWKTQQKGHEVVFHRQQLWVALQLALITCTSSTTSIGDGEELHTLGECLLLVNELIGGELARRNRELNNPESPEWFLANFLSMLELNWHSTGPLSPTRAMSMWCDMPSGQVVGEIVKRTLKNESLNERFNEKYGISLTFYLEFLLAVHFFVEDQNDQRQPLKINPDALSSLGDQEQVNRCWQLVSRTRSELAGDIVFGPRQSWAVDFSPIRRYPLIKVADGGYVCPDLQLLENYFDDALYWLIIAAFGSESNKVQQLYGSLFEHHINNVIGAFADHGSILARQFIRNPRFRSDKAEVADAALDWKDTLVLLEHKGTKLTRHQKYSGIPSDLMRGIDDAYAKSKPNERKGVAQLACSIQRILGGEEIDQTSSIGERQILPALIVAEPGIAVEFVRRRLDGKLRGLISEDLHERVLPLILLSQYEIEVFEALLETTSAEQVLRTYANELKKGSDPSMHSFSSYVFLNAMGSTGIRKIYIQDIREQQLTKLAERVTLSK